MPIPGLRSGGLPDSVGLWCPGCIVTGRLDDVILFHFILFCVILLFIFKIKV